MVSVQESIAEKRGNTDASLGVERASADATTHEAERARLVADDLIEHERIVIDDRLRKFRDGADIALAEERLASKAPLRAVAPERARADKAMLHERDLTDSVLAQERQRADDAVQVQRDDQAAAPTEEGHRTDTDDNLRAERGRVDSAVAFLDTTEDALLLAKQEVAHRSNVLAMVAHELRNPLAVIAMNADVLAERLDDPEVHEPAEQVQRSVARMQRLLLDLLDLARIEGGTLRVVKRPVDVGALLAEILTAYGPLFAKRGVTFESGPQAPGLIANFDHDRIVQVLSNLLANAMKFTLAGGTVSLHMESRPDGIELAVKDTGSGIAEHALPRVFNRFWQASCEPGTGLGLGLYICERIVAAHAGRIWVESALGKGTTFRFCLPAS